MFPVGVYKVEDYPLNWIAGTYYSTYKGNTFQVSLIENVKSEAEYDAVTLINLNNQGLNTDFTNTFLSKFEKLEILILSDNLISEIDLTENLELERFFISRNNLSSIDISNNTNLTRLSLNENSLTNLSFANNPLLDTIFINVNKLDAATNSQVLIDLDSHGLSNGYLQSTIFGGGSLTTAGQTAKTNLLSKGWTIVGI